MPKVDRLVADAVAFMRNAPLNQIGSNIYSLPDVINEIKDKQTRSRLSVLPYRITYKEPSTESIRFVSEFAKRTGDYRSLSAVDVRVLALCYELERECCGVQHLRTEPVHRSGELVSGACTVGPLDSDIPGFYFPQRQNVGSIGTDTGATESDDVDKMEENVIMTVGEGEILDDSKTDVPVLDEESVDSDDLDDDDNDGNWITPSNIKTQSAGIGDDIESTCVEIPVACLTTDFAMQNVLLQIGLRVVALDGQFISRVNTYVLKCKACFKVTSVMSNKFCPKCGNDSLMKVSSCSVDSEGALKYHVSKWKLLNTRGLKFSLPTPQGGKHGINPVLCADQPLPHQRLSKKAQLKTSPLDADLYVLTGSPFATTDVHSKGFNLGLANRGYTHSNANPSRDKHRSKHKR